MGTLLGYECMRMLAYDMHRVLLSIFLLFLYFYIFTSVAGINILYLICYAAKEIRLRLPVFQSQVNFYANFLYLRCLIVSMDI